MKTRLAWLPLIVSRLAPGPATTGLPAAPSPMSPLGQRDRSGRGTEDRRREADRVGAGLDIGQVDRLAKVELARARSQGRRS